MLQITSLPISRLVVEMRSKRPFPYSWAILSSKRPSTYLLIVA
jgi:hypothetical protein